MDESQAELPRPFVNPEPITATPNHADLTEERNSKAQKPAANYEKKKEKKQSTPKLKVPASFKVELFERILADKNRYENFESAAFGNGTMSQESHEDQFCNFLLLNSQNCENYSDSSESWKSFLSAIFYVGHHKDGKPHEYIRYIDNSVLFKNKTPDKIEQQILDIWDGKNGIIILIIFPNRTEKEANLRKAAMIESLGIKRLSSDTKRSYNKLIPNWKSEFRRRLGIYLLYQAFYEFLHYGQEPEFSEKGPSKQDNDQMARLTQNLEINPSKKIEIPEDMFVGNDPDLHNVLDSESEIKNLSQKKGKNSKTEQSSTANTQSTETKFLHALDYKDLKDGNEYERNINYYKKLEQVAFEDLLITIPDSFKECKCGKNTPRFFNYFLIDRGQYKNNCATSTDLWPTFLSSIFYVGKGQVSRPGKHVQEARKVFKQQGFDANTDDKTKRILQIWKAKNGVSILKLYENKWEQEALSREAFMIEAIGVQNLCQTKGGDYNIIFDKLTNRKKLELGMYLLYQAFNEFLDKGKDLKQFFLNDARPKKKLQNNE